MSSPCNTGAPTMSDPTTTAIAKPGLCVLRPFRRSDQLTVLALIEHAAMESVGDYFWAALFSEVCPQIAFVAIAVGFVALGLPASFCLGLVPIAILVMYIAIWAAHKIKVSELHGDLFNIPESYQADEKTGFWVAEVHDTVESNELSAHFNITKKVIYDFVTEEELDKRGDNLADYRSHTVVGCVALTQSANATTRAWLRRLAVTPHYRRRGIASKLLQLVMNFAREQDYKGLELLTTECHHQARNMYIKEGFEASCHSRYYLNVGQSLYLFSLIFNTKKSDQDGQTKGSQESVTNKSQEGLVNELQEVQSSKPNVVHGEGNKKDD